VAQSILAIVYLLAVAPKHTRPVAFDLIGAPVALRCNSAFRVLHQN